MKGSMAFIAKPSKEDGMLMLKILFDAFRKGLFKRQREGEDQGV